MTSTALPDRVAPAHPIKRPRLQAERPHLRAERPALQLERPDSRAERPDLRVLREPDRFDPGPLLRLGLPAHVFVPVGNGWTPAWLTGRLHCDDGWIALVQCPDATGREQTLRLPAHQVAITHPT